MYRVSSPSAPLPLARRLRTKVFGAAAVGGGVSAPQARRPSRQLWKPARKIPSGRLTKHLRRKASISSVLHLNFVCLGNHNTEHLYWKMLNHVKCWCLTFYFFPRDWYEWGESIQGCVPTAANVIWSPSLGSLRRVRQAAWENDWPIQKRAWRYIDRDVCL